MSVPRPAGDDQSNHEALAVAVIIAGIAVFAVRTLSAGKGGFVLSEDFTPIAPGCSDFRIDVGRPAGTMQDLPRRQSSGRRLRFLGIRGFRPGRDQEVRFPARWSLHRFLVLAI